ncbi:Pr6Pr family membrane protein [Nocardioides renjunii]|uniref:Pr6Pr family membrane protein n=1 Tax=Nocardioides renjunii TaxID=3095075 RepID=UPI002B0027F5|nr:Pr6Pr family membrane protein [Nocardioides sp. S-34]WQQ22511.1 Pr6Pr family membrane protein [Nocardioides sp. S-34]
MAPARARSVHLVVAAVAWFSLAFQLVLTLTGEAVLVDTDPPGLAARVYRFLAYFTIQSNLLVAVTSTALALDPSLDRRGWRVARVAALVGITVTGLVHFFLLRPLLDLEGPSWAVDKLLHMVVPALAVAAWAWAGPRPRITAREAAYALVWPVLWLAWTLVVGRVDGWVPYPFLDPDEDGWGAVGSACVGITILFILLFALYGWLDRRLRPTPR